MGPEASALRDHHREGQTEKEQAVTTTVAGAGVGRTQEL